MLIAPCKPYRSACIHVLQSSLTDRRVARTVQGAQRGSSVLRPALYYFYLFLFIIIYSFYSKQILEIRVLRLDLSGLRRNQ
jgi:hypothetical protein